MRYLFCGVFTCAMAVCPPLAAKIPEACGSAAASSECVISSEAMGRWNIAEVTSTGPVPTVLVTLASTAPLPGLFGEPKPAVMALRCENDQTSLRIYFGQNYMSDARDYGQVSYSIDGSEPVAMSLQADPRNESLAIGTGSQAIRFLIGLFNASEFRLSATSFTDAPLAATFEIEGLAEAIAPLRRSCHW